MPRPGWTPEKKYTCACGIEKHMGPMTQHIKQCWTPRTLERLLFLCGVEETQPGQCWVATKNLKGKPGYARAIHAGTRVRATRLLFLLATGELPPDWIVMMHTCDNPPCLNPEHVKPGTQAMNVQDMWEKGRGVLHIENLTGKGRDES